MAGDAAMMLPAPAAGWQAQGVMQLPPRPSSAQADLAGAFQAAAAASGCEEDPLLPNLRLTFHQDPGQRAAEVCIFVCHRCHS